jgi:hypothetical protein
MALTDNAHDGCGGGVVRAPVTDGVTSTNRKATEKAQNVINADLQ